MERKYQFRIVVDASGLFGADLHTLSDGLTKNSYNPKVFYESILKEGAGECVGNTARHF